MFSIDLMFVILMIFRFLDNCDDPNEYVRNGCDASSVHDGLGGWVVGCVTVSVVTLISKYNLHYGFDYMMQ
jgi:hypothetical protein